MADDFNYIHAALTGGMMAVTGFFAFISKRFIGKVDATEARLTQHEKDDIGKYATMDSLNTVHARINESVRTAEENFRELRNGIGEIKTILIQGTHK